jgi:KUP system potassium uptake protein
MRHTNSEGKKSSLAKISLAALGIVFGDIGTSPIYAFRECFAGSHGAAANSQNLIGAASLIIWSLIFIVTLKYVYLVLRLDNKGEGGILALSALVRGQRALLGLKEQKWIFSLGLLGAALIYADGMITPAISVLSAVEGMKIIAPSLQTYIVPISLVIIVGLFMIQRFGTGKVGILFGPIILLWFATLSIIGISWVVQCHSVVWAINPIAGIRFLISNYTHALPILAAVFLAVTGGEALYADLGHFGRKPIRIAWYWIVFPGLSLNYLGQAALITLHPDIAIHGHSFYNLVPDNFVLPLTILATCAAIIASQALISGAFSLTSQAIQLGCLPRIRVLFTSATEKGQVYLPLINWLLMIACLFLIAGYKTSSNLAAAYGIAIALTMSVTTLLFFQAARIVLGWSALRTNIVTAAFVLIDLCFLIANGIKIQHGGWLPLATALVVVFIMNTWRWGREKLRIRMEQSTLAADLLIQDVVRKKIHRVSGYAIYMSGKTGGIPLALLHNLKHNQVLHEKVLLLHVETLDASRATPEERFDVKELGEGFYLMHLRYGFSETPNVPKTLKLHMTGSLHYDPGKTTFFLGRETYAINKHLNVITKFRMVIFAWMTRNATPATAYFSLPPSRVVELGAQITL